MISEDLWPVINNFIKNEDYDTVLNMLESACGTAPDDAMVLAVMALMHCYLGDYERSDILLDKAMNSSDPPFEVYWIMGQVLLEAGQVDEAVAFWQKVETTGVESGYFDEIDHFNATADDIDYINACINDCRYMLSKVFDQLGKKHLTQRYKRSYLDHLQEGITSRFDAANLPE